MIPASPIDKAAAAALLCLCGGRNTGNMRLKQRRFAVQIVNEMSGVCVQMQAPELSLILPVRDIEIELPGILRSIKEQVGAATAEWIIVDMGSDDQTVLRAVQYIKEERLQGFVIQNGKGSVSAALNTGMQKAAGEYLSFVFARRLYGGYLSSYLEAARAARFFRRLRRCCGFRP